MNRVVRLGMLATWSMVAACLEPATITCPGGVVCSAGDVCAPVGEGCVDPALLVPCEGRAEGAACTLPGIGEGHCREQVCALTGCGDGVLDPGEACDDHNDVDDDGCTNACALPTCGDGVLQAAEECDDGAANADDRACTTTCLRARCGDGRVRSGAGGEACDAGAANADDGPCTTTCEVAACGDGHVWAGVEACDDGGAVSGDGCRADCRKVEVCGDAEVDAGEACDDGNANHVDGCDACVATRWTAAALLAGAVDALDVDLDTPHGVAADGAGNLYVADTLNHRVRRIAAADGIITTVAGTGVDGFSGDGGAATGARLSYPWGVAIDGLGNLFIADMNNQRIRRVSPDGVITTVVGSGPRATGAFAGDGGPATAARLYNPYGVTVDGVGNLYIADSYNNRIRRVDAATGLITTIAGTSPGGYAGDGGPAIAARLATPTALAIDRTGNLVFVDSNNNVIRRIDGGTGTINTIAGTGGYGASGDGGLATATTLAYPTSLALDADDNIYVAESGGNRVRRIGAVDGILTTVAGMSGGAGFAGDGGAPTSARLAYPQGLAIDRTGRLIIADTNNSRLRTVAADRSVIDTVAGKGGQGYVGDGGAATGAVLRYPEAVAVDAAGNLFIADASSQRIRRVDAGDGSITTVAGTGVAGATGDGGPATAAQVSNPCGVAIDSAGNLYIADSYNHRIRRVDAGTGVITTVMPYGSGGGLAIDAADNLYVADTFLHRVLRRAASDGTVTTVAGTGAQGSTGDGGLATSATLDYPQAIAFAADGTMFIGEAGSDRVRRVDPATGVITTFAGSGASGHSGDGGPAIDAALSVYGLAVDSAGNVIIADIYGNRIRRVDTAGIITTIAGTGVGGNLGDGGPAVAAQVNVPFGVAVDADDNVYIADHYAQRIRRIGALDGRMTTVAGLVDPEGTGPVGAATLADPQALVVAAPFTLLAGGASGVVEALRADGSALEVLAGRYPHATATGDLARYRASSFGSVGGVAYDAAAGVLYFTETSGDRLYAVTLVEPTNVDAWTLAVVGAGTAGFADGPLASARFRAPRGLLLDAAHHTLYVADAGNHVVRAIALDDQVITTVAGTPATLGYFGDELAATDALLFAPSALALAPDGDLFIADTGNHRVRRVAAGSGVITTVLGDGVAASSGEGAPAWTFPVDAPAGLTVDADGNLYVTSTSAVRLMPADDTGTVDGTGAVQTIYGATPRVTFPAYATSCLTGIAVVDAATVHATDACSGLLIELWRQPVVP